MAEDKAVFCYGSLVEVEQKEAKGREKR